MGNSIKKENVHPNELAVVEAMEQLLNLEIALLYDLQWMAIPK
jgi:hypothetical protein